MNDITKKFDSTVAEVKREMIRELLGQCTEDQVGIFNRIYGSIDVIPESKMRNAYVKCARTIEKNQKEKP